MPAPFPGATKAQNLANPSAGNFVIFDPLSGPKGSPLDVRKLTYTGTNNFPTYTNDAANQTPSTGALSTGIGIGPQRAIGVGKIFDSGYDDDFVPGQVQTYNAPPPKGNTLTNTVNSSKMYIGGGRMIVNPLAATQPGRRWTPSPYTAGVSLLGGGNGASRDAGVGPTVFTGFELKMVTAAGTVLNGAALEGSYNNRSGVTLTLGQSSFGSSTAASATPA